MENNESFIEKNPVSAWSIAIRYGLIGGLGLIILSLVGYLTGLENVSEGKTSIVTSILSYGIIIGSIVLAINNYKSELGGGILTFGSAFKVGFFTSLIMGLCSAVWMFIYFNIIDPESLAVINEIALEELEEQDLGEDELEMMMSYMKFFTSVPFFAFIGFLGSVIPGTIISLIAGAIFKNDN